MNLDKLYHPTEDEYLSFQKEGIIDIVHRKNVLLGDEMGLGKTIQCIGYINLIQPPAVLVVCPNNLRNNWLAELNKWLAPDLRSKYDIEECTTALYMPSNFIVASYEGLTKWGPVLKDVHWDLIIVDEAHYIKNMNTQRGKAVLQFKDMPCKKILITGTPILNYPYELFPLIHFLDSEQWPSFPLFQRRYCPYSNKYGYNLPELQRYLREGAPFRSVKPVTRRIVKTVPGSNRIEYNCTCGINQQWTGFEAAAHAEETGHEVSIKHVNIERIVATDETVENQVVFEKGVGLMIRRMKKDVLKELPRKRRQIIELPSEGKLLELVEKENEMWRSATDLQQQLEEALGNWKPESDSDFDRVIEAMRFNKRYFFDEIAIIRHQLALAKVPYVVEHISDLLENKDKLVCFIHHNDVGLQILNAFKDRAVLVYGSTKMEDRAENIQKFWEDDRIELFIGSLKTSGVGINLQNSSNIVFAELDWVPGVITQAEDRCHRIGQDKSLLVQHLVAQNSMDSNMAKKIVAKQKSIQKALNIQTMEKENA